MTTLLHRSGFTPTPLGPMTISLRLAGGGLRALLRSRLVPVGVRRIDFVCEGVAAAKTTVTIIAVPEHANEASARPLGAELRAALRDCLVRFLARRAPWVPHIRGSVLWEWSAGLDTLTYRPTRQSTLLRQKEACGAGHREQPT